jgi:hypothetical protein
MGKRIKRCKIYLGDCLVFCLAICASDLFAQNIAMGPVQNKVSSLLAHDDLHAADSLCTAFDLTRFMGPYELMKWVRIKGTLGQYEQAARLACMALGKDPHFGPMLQYQLVEVIKEAKIDTVRVALNAYCHCALGGGCRDTLGFKQWISGTYNRFGLYDEEIDVLVSLDSKNYPSVHDLLESARQRFSQRLFAQVIRPAQQAYARSATASQKALCALLLYQSYAQTERNDSAALWLARVPLAQELNKAEVITFFQHSRYFVKADSLIATLPPSFMRDTLAIRQMLFNGNMKGAADAAARMLQAQSRDKDNRNESLLWRIRALIFGGAVGTALPLLDSINFTPSMNWAEEFLSDKYALYMIQGFPSAWKDFGSLRYASWAQQPDIALRALGSQELENCPAGVKELLIIDGAKTLSAGKLFSEARKILERIALSAATAEHRYYYAESLLNTGAPEQARQVLEELVLKCPGDVFSEKARIVLLRLQNKI